LSQTAEEERAMIDTLQQQLRFVRNIQKIDTAGVEPLCAIRDETTAANAALTVGCQQLHDVLTLEARVGHGKRPRRRRDVTDSLAEPANDMVKSLDRAPGRYFIVRIAEQGAH
jgi:Asp-tRNA(Asn)/Glu-tRNA(Gln) amidotransferase C subunit